MLEWEQDGQYFHYLTRWMHALSRVGAATGDPRINRIMLATLLVPDEYLATGDRVG